MKKLLLILFSILNIYPNDYTIITHENGGTTWIPNTWESNITQENDTIWEPNTWKSNHLNLQERKQCLENYTKELQLDPDVNLGKIAYLTYSKDHLSHVALVYLAVNFAKQRSSETISAKDLDRALNILLLGQERMETRNSQEIWRSSVHEAGHALVCMILNPQLFYKVTIIPHVLNSGSTFYLFNPEENYGIQTHCSHITTALAGAAAEEIILNDSDARLIITNTGSYRFLGDYLSATDHISTLLRDFGGDGILTVDGNKKLSPEEESTYSQIILKRHYDKAKELIKNNKDKLIKIAKALVERKTLTEIEVKELVESSKESANKIVQPAPQIQRRKNQVVYAAHAKLKKATVSHKK